MFYSKLSIKGFGPHYKKKNFDFEAGMNIITGVNGSGKTTIFDAIQWVLYGPRGSDRTLKDRASIINDRSQTARVDLTFYSEVGDEITINRTLSRSGKHSINLVVAGEKIDGTLTELQHEIDAVCGNIDADVFSSVSMMMSSPTNSVNKFISGTPLNRRKVLASIVDPEDMWAESHKVFKKKLASEKKALQALSNKKEIAEGVMRNIRGIEKPEVSSSDIAKDLEILYKQQDNSSHSVAKRLKVLKVKNNSLINEETILKEKLDNAKKENEELYIRINNKKKELIDSKKKEEDEKNVKNRILYQLDSLEYQISFLEQQTEYLNSDKTNLLAILTRENTLDELLSQSGNSCAVCGAELDSHNVETDNIHKEAIARIETKINKIEEKLEKSKKEREFTEKYYRGIIKQKENTQDWDSKIRDIENDIQELESKKNEKFSDISVIEKTLSAKIDEIDDVYDEIQHLEEHYDEQDEDSYDINEEIQKLERELARAENQEKEFVDYINEVDEKQKELDAIISELDWKEKTVNQLVNLVAQSSPTGAISDKIDEFCDEVNNAVNDIYEEVFEKDANISVESASDDQEPTCMIYSQGRNIETYSHGEQARMIMALLCALTEILLDKTGIWLPPLWDEPTLPIDSDDKTTVLDVLSNLAENNNQCFVITRDNDIVDEEETIINV